MATRLLSFLNDVEQTLIQQSAASGQSWLTSRMVNYHHNLARLTLAPAPGADAAQLRGTIFIQSFELANGSHCSKASLSWQGVDSFPVLSVYAKPDTNWKAEASRIAGAWLAGSVPAATAAAEPAELAPLVAQAS